MSIRETVVKNIVTTLEEIVDLKPALVTREPFDVEKLAITQFPAILINSSNEARLTETMGTTGIRQGVITYVLNCYVRGNEIDSKRNNLIEAIEEALDADRKRNLSGTVLDTQVTAIAIVDRLPPLGEVVMTVEVRYVFTRGVS